MQSVKERAGSQPGPRAGRQGAVGLAWLEAEGAAAGCDLGSSPLHLTPAGSVGQREASFLLPPLSRYKWQLDLRAETVLSVTKPGTRQAPSKDRHRWLQRTSGLLPPFFLPPAPPAWLPATAHSGRSCCPTSLGGGVRAKQGGPAGGPEGRPQESSPQPPSPRSPASPVCRARGLTWREQRAVRSGLEGAA